MSTELAEAPKAGTALTVTHRAVLAIGLTDAKKEELKQLAAKTASITAITNGDGYKQVHAARMVLKNERIELEKLGKAAREDATAFSKAVIAQEKIAIGLIEPEEKRLQALQDEHDAKEERARQAKIEAEQKRVEAIQERLTEIRAVVEVCTRYNSTATEIAEHMDDIERIVIDDSFEEFRSTAEDAKIATLAKLREAHAAALTREDEQRRAAAAQAELERLRAENAVREAKETAERQERERVEREAREAEEKAARERLAAEQAEIARKQKEEQDRIDAENARLAAERAEFQRQQDEAQRKAYEAERQRVAAEQAEQKRRDEIAAAAKKAKYPGDAAVIDVLVKHFGVTEAVVRGWLSQLKVAA